MLYESLNGPKEPEKSLAQLQDEQLDLNQQVNMVDGSVFTAQTGLKAMLFYRDYAWRKQGRKKDNSATKTIFVNNPRKKHALS
jgi:hypothetical protein